MGAEKKARSKAASEDHSSSGSIWANSTSAIGTASRTISPTTPATTIPRDASGFHQRARGVRISSG